MPSADTCTVHTIIRALTSLNISNNSNDFGKRLSRRANWRADSGQAAVDSRARVHIACELASVAAVLMYMCAWPSRRR